MIFASENIADEHKPWATIIIRAPELPQFLNVMVPEIIRPMWPIDE